MVALATGDYHTLALKADGTVAAWGAGSSPFSYTFAVLALGHVVVVFLMGYL